MSAPPTDDAADSAWIDFGGIKLTKRAASTIAGALLAIPGFGQYALSASGVIDPSGSHRVAIEATKAADGQLEANVLLINLYESQAADLRKERDELKANSRLLQSQLQDCHTTVSASGIPIPDSALEIVQ